MVALHYPPLALYPRYDAETEQKLIVEGRRLDHSVWARREPRVRLVVHEHDCDHAVGVSDVPLVYGEQIVLKFPAQAGRMAWRAFGRVVACEPGNDEYRVTVDFAPLRAA
jgi:hypothetical protein